MPSLATDVDQFSWSMYAAVALKNLSWIAITMAWAFPHVDTGKMLALFAKVRCSVEIYIIELFLQLYSNYLLTVVNPPVDLTANCTLGDVRLVNGTSVLEGRVEVCFGNLWGTICHNSWDNRDAGVICKRLFNSSFGELIVCTSLPYYY